MSSYKYQLAQHPKFYAALGALLVSLVVMLVFTLLMSVDQLQKLDQTQRVIARKIQNISLDTRNTLRILNEELSPDCSEKTLNLLRQQVFMSTHQADMGVLDEKQRLLCSAVMGVLPVPLDLPAPDAITNSAQGQHYVNFRQRLMIADGRYRATMVRMGRFSTVISPHALDDLFAVEEGLLWVRMADGTMQLAHVDQALPVSLKERLGQAPLLANGLHGYSWEDHAFISSRHISSTSYISQYLVPLPQFWRNYSRHLGLAALLSVIVGVLLYGALVPVVRRLGWLPQRIAGLLRDENMLCMYQPIVDIKTGVPVGCEVLMRLRDGSKVLYPDRVLPAVTRANLCWELDQAVVRRAIHELCTCLPGNTDLTVSFNIFPKNIDCTWLHKLIEAELARYPATILRFDLEVIEQSDQSRLLPEITKLKQAGYRISIDDFGTGYSNLKSVKALAPDVLKIDKSFVFEMEDASVRSSLIPEIVGIARVIGAKVVAEGIENEAQRQRLLDYGVDYGQGYLFARPMEIDAFVRYLRNAPGRELPI